MSSPNSEATVSIRQVGKFMQLLADTNVTSKEFQHSLRFLPHIFRAKDLSTVNRFDFCRLIDAPMPFEVRSAEILLAPCELSEDRILLELSRTMMTTSLTDHEFRSILQKQEGEFPKPLGEQRVFCVDNIKYETLFNYGLTPLHDRFILNLILSNRVIELFGNTPEEPEKEHLLHGNEINTLIRGCHPKSFGGRPLKRGALTDRFLDNNPQKGLILVTRMAKSELWVDKEEFQKYGVDH